MQEKLENVIHPFIFKFIHFFLLFLTIVFDSSIFWYTTKNENGMRSSKKTENNFTLIKIANFSFPECRLQNECIVTTDRDYLGNGNVDLFDALVIQIRFFLNDKGQKISEEFFAFYSSKI